MESDQLIKRSLKISCASFLFGTGLLILFFFTNAGFFAFMSLPSILVLGGVNFILFVQLCRNGIKEKENRKRLLRTAGIISLNIPVVFLYTYFVFVLFETFVVRFKNNTDKTLTNISVSGCDKRIIQDLQPGQSEIEWIPITRSCIEKSIVVEYHIDGTLQRETVYGYVVSGQRINHKIGESGKQIVRE
jgi:hypothetical protein